MIKATSMSFEQRFLDDSGVEHSVSCDETHVTFAACSTSISLPLDKVDWLIECLEQINLNEAIPIPKGDNQWPKQ